MGLKRMSFLFVLMAGILWGMLGLFVRRYDAAGLTTMDVVAVRAIATTFCLGLVFLVGNRGWFRIRWKDLWCFLGTGLCSIVFFNYCYFKAITFTSMSVAAVLLYTAPAIVMVLSRILFGERLGTVKLLALGATFLGCVLVTGLIGDAGTMNLPGILIGLGAGLGYALYSIFSRFALERGYHTATITFYTFLIAAFGALPLSDGGRVLSALTADAGSLLFALAFGVVTTVLPFLFYTLGLSHMENGTASIIASIEPVVATLLGVVFYKEKLTLGGFLGVVLVLGAIVACNLTGGGDKKGTEEERA